MLTRRHLIRSATAAGAIGALPAIHTAAQTTETTTAYEPIAKIGDTREVFDSEYGTGREENGWVSYGEDDPSTAFYNVFFNANGIAETIEIDFRHLEGGGITSVDNIGISRFVPDDGENITQALAGAYRANEPYYGVWQWHSPSLADATGRTGNVIVMDAINYAGIELGTIISHTMISMETFEVNELVPTDEFLGPHSGIEAWEEYSGEQKGMFGLPFSNGPVPGSWMATEKSVSVELDPPLSTAEANDLAGSMMPLGEITYTTYIPPSPLGELGIRAHGIQVESNEGWNVAVALQWVADGEEAGVVTQIMTGYSIDNPDSAIQD